MPKVKEINMEITVNILSLYTLIEVREILLRFAVYTQWIKENIKV